jgi:SPP1 gp7 family putative phage head morphogenesis protein
MKPSFILIQQIKKKKKLPKFPRLQAPLSKERDYERWLTEFLETAAALIRQKILSQLPRWQQEFERGRPANLKNDSDPSLDILAAMEDVTVSLSRQYTPDEIRRFAQKTGQSVSDYNSYLLKNGMQKVLNFDIFLQQPYLKSELNMFATLNTELIVKMKDDMLAKVQGDVMRGFAQGVRHEEIAKDLEGYIDPLNGTVRSRARLIARDQVNKLNGQLTELRQNELGISRYTWRTMGDERVRETHAAKDGKVFSWDDPPADTGNPGEEIQCRCYAEPILSDLLQSVQEPEE